MKLPADIAARLTPEQAARVESLLAQRTLPHAVDYRASTSLFGRRYYAAFFAGRDARSLQRVCNEGQARPMLAVLRDGFVASAIVTLMLCILTALIFGGLFALKWTTGINLLLS